MVESNGRGTLSILVLWETGHELVLVKPSGMATELTRDPKRVSLLARVQDVYPRARLPHRLDRVTRGLVVVAKTDKAIAWHSARIREGAWGKVYLARVRASADLSRLVGTHKLHLRKRGKRAEIVRSGGKRALTEILTWSPAPNRHDEAHVLVRLLTGRYHQIRATLAHLGAPLVDDWLYGTSPGQEAERFYLEHAALRFVPCGESMPRIVHWRDDPNREPMDADLHGRLNDLLTAWEAEGARPMGGSSAEERGDQSASA